MFHVFENILIIKFKLMKKQTISKIYIQNDIYL